jgi:hypothetical protein
MILTEMCLFVMLSEIIKWFSNKSSVIGSNVLDLYIKHSSHIWVQVGKCKRYLAKYYFFGSYIALDTIFISVFIYIYTYTFPHTCEGHHLVFLDMVSYNHEGGGRTKFQ